MKKYLIGFFLFLSILTTNAQAPNWSVDTRAFEFSMSLTAVLNVNGNRLINANDKVAAFVNDEIRGVGSVTYDADDDKYVVFFRVYANTTNETINFKIYDSTNDVVVNVPKTLVFEIDARVGGVFKSYSIASPTLSNDASLTSFSFQGITEISKTVDGTNYAFVLPQGTDITALTPVFTLPENARLFKNFIRQESGVNSQNFSSAITYTVLSADESVTQNYTISVSISGGGGSISATLQSANSNLTNNKIIELNLALNVAVIAVEKADFNLTNALIKSIVKQNDLLYKIEIVPLNQGLVNVQINENVLEDSSDNVNSASNVLSFTFDSVQPFITSIVRNNPSTEITGSNTLVFEITFSEAVNNVVANYFYSVENANINLTKQSNTNYTITVTNIDEFEGTVFVQPKETNTITDAALNNLRVLNKLNF